ncbi:MAG: hypothetical protein ACMVP2_26015 [Imperialibacter sp.]|uniref:hypothetical protein n=1 Tax=Imperialibacter sp. TaxID=2038411 RepID=UPI003A88D553
MKKNTASTSRLIRRDVKRKIATDKLTNKRELQDILYRMKYSLNHEITSSIIDTLSIDIKNYLLGRPLPVSMSELGRDGISPFKLSFFSEVSWLFVAFQYYHKEIQLFLHHEREFETAFLKGNYQAAEQVLNHIESNICTSFWAIEKRLLLEEYIKPSRTKTSGLTEAIRNDSERLVKIFSSYLSTRFERDLPPARYDDLVNKFAAKQRQQVLSNYFLFRLNYFENLVIEQPEYALYLESNFSVVDRYLTFIQVVVSLLCSKSSQDQHVATVRPFVVKLCRIINDPRLKNICLLLGDKVETSEDNKSDVVEVKELFFDGNFTACFKHAHLTVKQAPYKIEAIEYLIKSCIILNCPIPTIGNSKSLVNIILQRLKDIFTLSNDYDLAMYEMNKIAKSIACPIWCGRLVKILNDFQPVGLKQYNFELHSELMAEYLSTNLSQHLEDSKAIENFCKAHESFKPYSSSAYTDFRLKKTKERSQKKSLFNSLNEVKWFESQGCLNEATDILEEIECSSEIRELLTVKFVFIEIVKAKARVYHASKRTSEAIELICHAIISDEKIISALYNQELLQNVFNSKDSIILSNICVPILARVYEPDQINNIWIAYDNFMYENGYTFPTELFNSDFVNSDLKRFFLSYVCIQDVYDSSPFFTSPEHLDNERIEICNYLCLIDPEQKNGYINEITEIETRTLIKRGIKEIDESKIYVDTVGIKREISNEVKERFARGRELYKLKKEQIEYLLEMSSSVLLLYVPKKDDERGVVKFDESTTKELGIANHPHFENFKETFLLIRDRFISSNEFGLDSYISIRIRHGTLLGEIRSIFDRYKLITKRNSYTKQYEPNDYWIEKLCQNQTNSASVKDQFNIFSAAVDELSEEIKNSHLQIKTEDKASIGLFDYKYSTTQLISLYEDTFYEIDDHEVFFETVITKLWERTEENLTNLRDKFQNEFCNVLLKRLDTLMENIGHSKYQLLGDTNELVRDVTACKTDTTNALEKISLWFRRSYSNSINEFDIRLVVDICFSIVNKMQPQTPILHPNLNIDSKVIFKGEFFTFFIDILRNILDNILKHSELVEPELNVGLSITHANGKLRIELENNVASTVNLKNENKNIATTQHRIDKAQEQILVKGESGSGYLKINSILKGHLKRKKRRIKLDQINQDRIFKSLVEFELENLLKDY